MACHRFLWLNAINGPDVWRLMSGGKILPKIDSKNASGNFKHLISGAKFLEEFAQHIKKRSFQECFGEHNARLMLGIERIRFCPLCLQEAFHSPIFQIAGTNECPLHKCKIEFCCPNCGDSIGTPSLNPRDFTSPMACPRCHTPFLEKNFAERVVLGPSKGEDVFEAVQKDIDNFKNWQYSQLKHLDEDVENAIDYRSICDCLRYLNDVNKIAAEYPSNLIEVSDLTDINRLKYHHAGATPSNIPINKDLEEISSIIKSIGRHLRRRIQYICKHRHGKSFTWHRLNGCTSPVIPVLRFLPGSCPCCALMSQWSAYSGKIISLRNIVRELGVPVYDDRLGFTRHNFTLHPKACAEALLSSFTWFAINIVKRSDVVVLPPEGFWFDGEYDSYYQKRMSDSFSLDIYRFNIQVHGFLFLQEKRKRFFRYSLNYAMNELEACYRRRKEREAVEPEREFYGGFKDNRWYISMWEHFQNLHRMGLHFDLPRCRTLGNFL